MLHHASPVRYHGVFSDGCDSSAQLLHQFHCQVVSGPGCLYGNWNEDVTVGQLPVFGFHVRSGLLCCRHSCGIIIIIIIIILLLMQNLRWAQVPLTEGMMRRCRPDMPLTLQ